MQKPPNGYQKLAWLLIASGISAYAIYGLMADDLIIPYRPWSLGSGLHTRLFHLRGLWAIGGALCLLLGAAGFFVVFLTMLRGKPERKTGRDPYLYLASGLILVGVLFFISAPTLALWLVK